MLDKSIEINTALQIQKPAPEVFNAIVDPVQMSNYFISNSTGPMEEGKHLVWRFPEFDEDAPVYVRKINKDQYISFSWEIERREHIVEIELDETENRSTVVRITETGGENTEEGLEWLKQNTEGWANFLACLKAWLEYGINLRKGGFDFLRMKTD